MIEGRTSSGFAFCLDPDSLDDMELLEKIGAWDKGDITCIKDVIIGIIGQGGKDALYEHCRDEKGKVRASKVMTEIIEIFDIAKKTNDEAKN